MKKWFIPLLLVFSVESFAQQVFTAVLKDSDIPNYKCEDNLGGYYIFFQLKKVEGRDPFIVAVPTGQSQLYYEMVTIKKNLQKKSLLKFDVYDPMAALKDGKKTVYQMTLNTNDKVLNLFSIESKKSYALNCTVPVKGVDYE